MNWPHDCRTPAEMHLLGRELARGLAGGEVLGLCGELGAGKTELVKGLAAGLEVEGVVTSPTFTILQEYRGGRCPLLHFDFYRVEQAEEVLDLGWDELRESGAVVVVEWADLFPALLPPEALILSMEILPADARRVDLAEFERGP